MAAYKTDRDADPGLPRILRRRARCPAAGFAGRLMETSDAAQYELTERRIAWLTLIVGALAAVGASFLFTIRIGAGVLIGAVLAWINFRWLGNALDAVTRASIAQAGSLEARV